MAGAGTIKLGASFASPIRMQGPKDSTHPLLLPQFISGELDGKCNSSTRTGAQIGRQRYRYRLSKLCH